MSSYPEEIYEYEDPRPLARWLNRILYLCVIEMALELALTIIPQYLLAYRMNNADGYFRYLKPVKIMNESRDALGVFYWVFLVLSVLMVFIWLRRANENLRSFDQIKVRFTPAGAIYWWFIPLMNIFRPYQIMGELWRGSLALIKNENSDNENLLFRWWFCFLACAICVKITTHTLTENPAATATIIIFTTLAQLSYLTSALTLIKITRTISDAQAEYHARQA